MAVAAIEKAPGRIRIDEVGGVDGLLRATLSEEGLMLGALSCGFFGSADAGGPQQDQQKPTLLAARFLREEHENRFWRGVEERLAGSKTGRAKHLLLERVRCHIRQEQYPERFGRRLLSLLRSLPMAVRRLQIRFPLLPEEECMQLSRLARGGDYEDVRCLLNAAGGALAHGGGPTAAISSQVLRCPLHDH